MKSVAFILVFYLSALIVVGDDFDDVSVDYAEDITTVLPSVYSNDEAEPMSTSTTTVATISSSSTTAASIETKHEEMERELNEQRKMQVLRAERLRWTAKQNRYMKLPIRRPKLRPGLIGHNDTFPKHTRRSLAKKMMLAYGLRNREKNETTKKSVSKLETLPPPTSVTSPSASVSNQVEKNATDNSISVSFRVVSIYRLLSLFLSAVH